MMAIGKTNRTRLGSPDFRHLSLRGHSLDAAGAAFALLRGRSLLALEKAAGRRLDAHDVARICFLVGLHDIGKAMVGFYLKAIGHPTGGTLPPESVCHIRPLLWLLNEMKFSRIRGVPLQFFAVSGLEQASSWFSSRKSAIVTLEILLSHHKGCRAEAVQRDGFWKRQFETSEGYDPVKEAEYVAKALSEALPLAMAPAISPLPDTELFMHAFLGLVEHADWLASTRTCDGIAGFDLDGDTFASHDRFANAVDKASKMLATSGFYDALGLRKGATLGAILGKGSDGGEKTPRPLQSMVASLPISAVLGIEAPTGEGKTEAALIRFFMLHAAGLADGLYFATPNRSAAFSLHRRIVATVKRLYPGAPVPVLAVPGMECPNVGDGTPIAWSSEGGRYLSSGIAVGTIDQLLLGGLRVPYSHVRGFASPRLHLVIDEVHSCDPYMMRTLRNAIEWHLALGGTCTLLSATFGSDGLGQLGGRTYSLSEAMERPYPCVWHGKDFAHLETATMSADISRARRVSLKRGHLADAVAATVEAVAAGARVVAIFSTVRSAREFQVKIERLGCPTFSITGPGGLTDTMHHGRYAAEDRRVLDEAVEKAVGKDAATPSGFVLVGTQTLEQSLDIDADVLVTDLCPMEVLIQRLGRLFRHVRSRPTGYETPTALVVAPDQIDDCIGSDGLVLPELLPQGAVYRNIVHLALTLQHVQGGEFDIPADNRRLVEQCTHPDSVKAYAADRDPKWLRHLDVVNGEIVGALSIAATARMNWKLPPTATENRLVSATEDKIRTRIGADTVDLETDFISFTGNRITRISIRRQEMKRLVLSAPVLSSNEVATLLDIGGQRFVYDRLGLRKAGR